MLVAEELRHQIAREANIGQLDLPLGGQWPALDFGWSLVVKQAAKDMAEQKFADTDSVFIRAIDQSTERKTPIINHCGKPAEQSIIPSKPVGKVTFDTFTVDTFDLTQSKTSAPDSTLSKQQKKQTSIDINPYTSMHDLSSFADTNKIVENRLQNSSFVDIYNDGNEIINNQIIKSDSRVQQKQQHGIRIGSPSQIDFEDDYIDDDVATMFDYFGKNKIKIDWNEVVKEERKNSTTNYEISQYMPDDELGEDYDDFLNKIKEYYSDNIDEGDQQKMEVQDNINAAHCDISSSDFNIDDFDDDDDDEFIGFDEEEEGKEFGVYLNTNSDEKDNYKTKALIYDILKYELLYDYKRFEQIQMKNGIPQLYGTDGSALLMHDRTNRLKNQRIYDLIYLEEMQQVNTLIIITLYFPYICLI